MRRGGASLRGKPAVPRDEHTRSGKRLHDAPYLHELVVARVALSLGERHLSFDS